MLKRLANILLAFPVAVALIAIAVANRHKVELVLDPVSSVPAATLVLPFYAYLLGMLVLGVALGGVATWMTQARYRRAARIRAAEAKRWRAEADRLTRERDADLISSKSKELVPASRRSAA